MTTARIQLFQLSFTSRNREPDGAAYGSKPLAMVAQLNAARACLGYVGSEPETLRDALENGDIETIKPRDQIETLDDLTDTEVFELAESWSDFRSDIYPSWIEVDVYDLTEAIRAAGAAVTVFTTDDLTDRFGGDDAAGWLRSNQSRIEDTLSERGNEAIDDLLTADGLLHDDDDDDDDDEEDAMRLRGVTPEAFEAMMKQHTAFVISYGGPARVAATPTPDFYATLESAQAEPGRPLADIHEVETTPDERGFYKVVKTHPRRPQ